ncbi:MAG: crossover junction endodeoxyribonuclease RuvC [Candidatus Roizmanbacteria bacterium]
MIILSIDPGFDKVGYAIFDKLEKKDPVFVTSGLIKTNPSDTITLRLKLIHDSLTSIIETYKPNTLVMEQLFMFKNQKTVIGVAQAQGSIMLLTSIYQLRLVFLTPLQIKQIITGDGRADKTSVFKLVQLQLKVVIKVKHDDEADAIACGLAFCFLNEQLL